MNRVLLLAGSFCLAAPAFGNVLFQDDFNRANLASPMWQTLGSAYITADPLNQGHGGVLAFSALAAGGNLFSIFQTPQGTSEFLSFDYLTTAGPGSSGGYIGIDDPGETWLAGDPGTGVLSGVPHGQWLHFDLQFTGTGNDIRLKLEQWSGGAAPPNTAFFDNIGLSNTGFVEFAPEPSTISLLSLGMPALLLALRLGSLRRRAVRG